MRYSYIINYTKLLKDIKEPSLSNKHGSDVNAIAFFSYNYWPRMSRNVTSQFNSIDIMHVQTISICHLRQTEIVIISRFAFKIAYI